MSKEIINDLNSGTVHITEDVIISIASVETNNIDGIYEIPVNMVERLSGRAARAVGKDIEVNIDEENVFLTIKTAVEYGKDIIEISKFVQEKVRDKIELMTGLNVMEVNVIINNIVIPKEPKEIN